MYMGRRVNPSSALEHTRKFVRNRSNWTRSCQTRLPHLLALAVRLGGVVALVYNKVLGPVVLATGEVLVEDSLGAVGVTLRL